MNRLRHMAWYALVALSALLWMMTVALWTAGGWTDKIGRLHRVPFLSRWEVSAGISMRADRLNTVQLIVRHYPNRKPAIGPNWGPTGRASPALDAWLKQHNDFVRIGRLGFYVSAGPQIGGVLGGPATAYGTRVNVIVPFWALVILLAILPAIAIWLWARSHHRRPNPSSACKRCGYDLTANVSGICPECGTKVQSPPLRETPVASLRPCSGLKGSQ